MSQYLNIWYRNFNFCCWYFCTNDQKLSDWWKRVERMAA